MIIRQNYIYILLLFFIISVRIFATGSSRQDSINLFYSIYNQIDETKYSQTNKADSLVNELNILALHLKNNPLYTSRAIFQDITLQYISGYQTKNYTDSIFYLIQHCDSTRYPYEYSLLYHSLFMTEFLSNEYTNACNYGLQALKYATKSNNKNLIAEINKSISRLFRTIGEYSNSLEYGYRALEHYKRNKNKEKELGMRINLYNSLYLSGEKEQAISQLLKYIPTIKKINSPYLLTAAYINLGAFYVKDSRRNKSFEFYKKALDISKQIDNYSLTITILHNIGAYYLRVNQPDSSYKYLKRVEAYYIKHNIDERLTGTYAGLSLSFSQKKQYDSAYIYHVLYDSIRNHLLGNERISLINKTEAKYILSDYQNKLKIAHDEYTIKKKQTVILVISATGVILIILLTLLIVVKQKKIVLQQKELKELENKQLNEKLQEEKESSQQQKKEFTQTIDSRNREISTSLLLLSNKNLILNKILQLTNNYNQEKSDLESYKKEIDTLIKDNLNIDEEWNEFKMHFEKVHPLFFHKLKQQSKELTENDLRLCAYIKIGMRAKEIAQILSVSPDSIKMSRYRIKKKLNAIGDTSIDDFLRDL